MIESVGELLGQRVAIFGLSGNPPTGNKGHGGIVKFLVQTGLFDEVWVLPVYQHMYATKSSMTSYEHRMHMCKIMEDISCPRCRVRVMPTEMEAAQHYEHTKGREYRVGTVDILDFILSHFPTLQLQLVLGTDTFRDLIAGKWKQSDRCDISPIHILPFRILKHAFFNFDLCFRILTMVTLHVISRQGVEASVSGTPPTQARVFHHHVPWLTEVSSSQIRGLYAASVERGEQSALLEDLLDPPVLEYIKANNLYSATPGSS